MGVERRLAEVGQAAGIPQPAHGGGRGDAVADLAIGRQHAQRLFVRRLCDPFQQAVARRFSEGELERFQ